MRMHRKFWAAGLLLALCGCDLNQPSSAPVYGSAPEYGYAPGYAPDYSPGYYPPPGYSPPPEYPPSAVYPGYSYNNGVPTIIEGGAAVPLVFFGGEWGYYD
ncbi:MAG TPA: hypothetical protein VE690_14700, partial [Rhodopila sp.]|nr:hypothetical protein [Rhodopila sp.]